MTSLGETIAGSVFSTTFTYDSYGRPGTRTHPSGIVETFGYNSYGYLSTISAGGSTRYSLTGMNAREQLTGATFGSSLSASYGFDSYGYPCSTSADTLQDYRYSFDPVTGNLNSRQNYKRSLSESFLYDNLERLTTVTGPQNLAMTYSANGNIQTKSDISPSMAFTYGTYAEPYALTSVTSSTGVIPTASQTATYNSFEKVSSLTEGAYAASFVYNSNNQRAKMTVTQSGSTILTRWYAGSRYMKETASGVTKEYTYLGGDAYSAPVVAVTQSGTTTYYYLLRDYLGNITHQVNTSNTVVAEYNFDAWGRRRSADDWSYTLDANDLNLVADRGFTGHEFLKYFNLYNMNGRLYDPLVGRFLNVDPYVQMPDLSQSYNRYTYCLNNPLKFTDPSGYRLAAADEYWNLDKSYTAWLSELQYRFGHSTSADGADGGSNFADPWSSYESFWSSILASVPSWQDGYSIKSSSFGKKNGVEGVWINTVNVGTPTRVGEVGSSNFNAFFFVDFTRKFIAINNAQVKEDRIIGTNLINISYSRPGDQFWTEFNMAAGSFARNYREMRKANTIGADKYFHCKANFEAASYGPGGVFFANHFSNLREIWDQHLKGYPRLDSFRDQEANKWGRDQVGEALNSCKACEKYRPEGLSDKY